MPLSDVTPFVRHAAYISTPYVTHRSDMPVRELIRTYLRVSGPHPLYVNVWPASLH